MIESILSGHSVSLWQLAVIGGCFIWSGFVRSGLGFGGAALSLPLMLLVIDDPIVFLPALCWHLLFFSVLTVLTRMRNVNWRFLLRMTAWLSVPFVIGVLGLLNLPGSVLSLFVYGMTLFYGINYFLNRVLVSRNRYMDAVLLGVGGYAAGVSLIGAPLIAAASVRQIARHQLRDTLFVLWIVLVVIKMSAFVVAGVSLQWTLTLLTFPLVGLGHWAGLRLHQKLVSGDPQRFHRFIGVGLSAVSILGIGSLISSLTV